MSSVCELLTCMALSPRTAQILFGLGPTRTGANGPTTDIGWLISNFQITGRATGSAREPFLFVCACVCVCVMRLFNCSRVRLLICRASGAAMLAAPKAAEGTPIAAV